MTMTHKEAIDFVMGDAPWDHDYDAAKIQIRAYIEARELVLVPREATQAMRKAGEKYCGMANCVGDEIYIYDDMIVAAPDPFEGGE